MRKEYRLWQIGNALRAAGMVTFMSCVLYAGKIHYDQQRVGERTAQLDAAAAEMERRYQAVIATFPPMPMDNDALRQVVDRLQVIQKGDHLPGPLLRHLAQALDRAERHAYANRASRAVADASSTQSLAALRGVLPSTSLPSRVIAVETIPRTGSGKAIRAELQRLLAEELG